MIATRFPKLWKLLTGEDPQAAKARVAARADYLAAVERGDTRAQHAAHQKLRDLTNRELAGLR